MQWQARPTKELHRYAAALPVLCCAFVMMFVLPARHRQQCNLLTSNMMNAQLIGNSVRSWKSYYDLNRVLREGQSALDDMAVWRQSMADSILMRTAADTDEESEECEDEEEDDGVGADDEDDERAGFA